MNKIAAILTLMLLLTCPVLADATASANGSKVSADKSAPTAEKQVAGMKVTVVRVTGIAEKLIPGETEKWVEIKPGDKLDELTIVRTGMRSEVVLRFADRGEVTVNRCTKAGITEFRKHGAMVKTHIGLKYGVMQVTVDSTRGPVDARVSTPVATLSVRGSKAVIAHTGDRGLGLRGQAGTWRVAAGNRTRNVVAGESTNTRLSRSIDLLKQRGKTLITGLTRAEQNEFSDNPRSQDPFGAGGLTGKQSIQTGPSSTTFNPPDDHIIP